MSGNPLKLLDDGQVEDIAGGYLLNSNHLVIGIMRMEKSYEVIDDKSDVVARSKSVIDAKIIRKRTSTALLP